MSAPTPERSPWLPNRATAARRRCAGTRTGRGAGVQSTQRVDRSSTPRGAQVQCVVAVLSNGTVVSGSWDTLKVWEDVEGKMARLVALRRTQKNFAGRLIAAFL